MFLDLQYFSVGILHCFPVNLTVIFYSVCLNVNSGERIGMCISILNMCFGS